MPISDKTRKLLWGRSGNLCAMCRVALVVEATAQDAASIVGEECHIVSGKPGGPRYDPTFTADEVDGYDNLILLCSVHHKQVDDQEETYSRELLNKLKENHDRWVASILTGATPKPLRLRRPQSGAARILVRLKTGSDLIKVIHNAHAFSFSNDEPESEAEAELLATLMQELQDYADIDLEAGERIRFEYKVSDMVDQLEQAGYYIFGGRETRVLEGGESPPSSFPIAIVRIVRSTSKEIVSLGQDESKVSP